jgi:hypothetical protein
MLIAELLCFAILQHRDISHRNADFIGELGNAHFSFRQHDVDVNDDCHVRFRWSGRSQILSPRHFVGAAQTPRRLWR